MRPSRLLGLETEYGLSVEGKGPADLTAAARALVRACPGPAAGPWDYASEDPRRDLRGFRARRLARDPDDARYDDPSEARLSAEEERADRVLANGARFYNDHGHPEYATPECRGLRDLIAHDRAGERLALESARRRSAETGLRVRVFKNNTDFHGMAYGCHENYLLAREVPFERLLAVLVPFFVTRILYAGAGKVGAETRGPGRGVRYQLSQRADFFTEEASVDTLHHRPLVNTRDEPHADPARYRRLHVICGDANPSEFATALKVGTTSLVLALSEAGWQPPFRVRRPVEALRRVSRDPEYRWPVELERAPAQPAVEIQRAYLAEAARRFADADAETNWVLREWERVLDDLEREPLATADRLDWAAKRVLLDTYLEAEGQPWDENLLRSLDLEYHDLDPEYGLAAALTERGELRRLVGEEEIQRALAEPPGDTRAALRGDCVRRFGEAVRRIGWGRIALEADGETRWADLRSLVGGDLSDLARRLRAAETPAEWLQVLEGGTDAADQGRRTDPAARDPA